MDKPSHHRLAIKEPQSHRAIQRFQYKVGEVARDKSKKFEVAPKLMNADTGLERPGIRRETRKETSECEVRVVLIQTKST